LYARWLLLRGNFRECPKGEVRRIPIPRTRVNKGKRKSREFSPALLSSVLAPLLAAYSLSL
jgi:hypothetical protein